MKTAIRMSRPLPALLLLLMAACAQAATYYVATNGNDANPGTQASPFRNIARGITAAAASGDTVQVAAGTYNERITWNDKSLALQGAGIGSSIIDGEASGSCLTVARVLSTARITGFTIRNGQGSNQNFGKGGGMNLLNSSLAISNCQFLANRAVSDGGALYALNGSPSVIGCIFSGNLCSGTGQGGGIYLDRSSAQVVNSLFTGNSGTDGGGIFVNETTPTISHCTFSGNSVVAYGDLRFGRGGAIFVRANGIFPPRTTLYNCILWGNTSENGRPEVGHTDFDDAPSYIAVTYSCVKGGYTGTGNITTDPRFIGSADYRLQSTSPSINTATRANSLPNTDLDGRPRILGTNPDMGAYEYWTSTYGLFVDKALGNDSSSTGGPTAPYKTVVKAITVAPAGGRIYIKAGNYGTDRPRITKSLKLYNWQGTGSASIGKL